MELSNSAKEIVVQAQMLMLSTGGSGLCVEHLFYGILLLADYLDPPMNKPEFREDGEKVRAWLEEGGMRSVAAARKQLGEDAQAGGSMFRDAAAVLGRAAEIAEGGEIGALELARAVKESSTPTILALHGLIDPDLAGADARYHSKPEKGKKAGSAKKKSPKKADEQVVLKPEMVRDPAPVKRAEEPAEKKPSAGEGDSGQPEKAGAGAAGSGGPAGKAGAGAAGSGGPAGNGRGPGENNGPGNGGQAGDKEGLTTSQLGALLALFALAQSQQTDELRQNVHPGAGRSPGQGGPIQGGQPIGGQKTPKVKKRTKMGLFTYRGGTVAAAIQYFLFGLIVPFVILVGVAAVVNKVTGGAADRATGFPMFLIYLYISVWIFYLLRGVALLFGIASSAFGNFLDILCDFFLIRMVIISIQSAWYMPTIPVWLRVIASAAAYLVLNVGIVLFDHLRDEGDYTKTRLNFQNKEGTVGKIYFQSLAESCRLPLLIFFIIWIPHLKVPALVVHILWILGFFWVWNNVFNAYFMLCVRCDKGHHRGLAFFQFLHAAHLFMTITEFVVFLHWHFQWFPMKRWVMIVLGIYSLLAFFCSFMYSRIK